MSTSNYDFVCLCCGQVNGASDGVSCSFHQHYDTILSDTVLNSEGGLNAYLRAVGRWLTSPEYKGVLLVASGAPVDRSYLAQVIEMTRHYQEARPGQVVMFSTEELGDLSELGVVSLRSLLH